MRVDILERLADLIRPALAWREGAPASKPAASFPGGGFTIVSAMTSLIGASGEDFASILRSLGYRNERRPKPVEPVPAAALPEAVESTEPEVLDVGGLQETELLLQEARPGAADTVHAENGTQRTEEAQAPAATVESTKSSVELAAEDASPTEEAAPLSTVAVMPAAETGTDQQHATDEPVWVEVWRPGRPEGWRPGRGRRRDAGMETRPGQASPQQPEQALMPAPADGSGPAAEPPPLAGGAAAQGERQRRSSRRRGPERRSERPQRDRDRPQGRPAAFERREREKAPDPNSPFAKLAALKAQLEADAKERR